MKVTLWGARGSIAIPHPATRHYGVNTPCVQIDAVGEDPLILDAGMGLHWLGNALGKGIFGKGKGRANLLISHTQWSHIQGIPFFMPMLVPGNIFTIYGRGGASTMRELLLAQMQPTYCPVPNFFSDGIGANVAVEELDETPLSFGSLTVEHCALGVSHGGPCMAYRIRDEQITLVYMPVVEYVDTATQERAVAFAQDADVLIHDAYYSDDEYAKQRGHGHSNPRQAIDTALRAQVRRLVLFNHYAERTDTEIDAIVAQHANGELPVEAAREGSEYKI